MIEPVVADDDALTVRVLVTAELPAVTGLGLKEQVSPVLPLHEKFTLPLKPCTDVTVMVSVVVLPAVTVSVPFPDETWKSGVAFVTLMTTESVLLPLVP